MKLKCRPEDFRVEELPTTSPGRAGRFVYYRLIKRGLGTLEAVEVIRRRWNLSAWQIRYGGLKDRHAETIQYLTILNGPERPFRDSRIDLEPLGRLDRPYSSQDFRGNRFALVIRDLSREAADRAKRAAEDVPRDGLPNYFDDQRFGSIGPGGEFLGEAWLKGDAERALKLAIAGFNPHDRAPQRAIKKALNGNWGRWHEAKQALPRSHERSIVTYLADHPTDFDGAFCRLNRDLRSLYFSAFQSDLWNRMLAAWLGRELRPEQLSEVEFKVGPLPFPCGLDPDQIGRFHGLMLPLPCARTKLPGGPLRDLADSVLEPRGLTWEALRIKKMDDVFFGKGQRAASFVPAGWISKLADDELHPGRLRWDVGFELPRGAYATIVVKRLTDVR
ncbi:MAG: tRNA pseudouridine(13) synthase TruD [Isosphaeraceae bacterium]